LVIAGPETDDVAALLGDLVDLGCALVVVPVPADGDICAALTRATREVDADAGPDSRIAFVDGRFVGHPHALRLVISDTRFPAAHLPGVLVVEGEARAEAVRALADPAPTSGRECVPDLLAERVSAAAHVSLREVPLGDLVAAVPRDEAEQRAARAAVAAVDDERIRLVSAVKARDGFFTTFAVSTWSRYLARWCAGRGFTPNQVTVASLLVALAAAGGAATGTRAGYIGAALGLYFSFVLDCTDGQLARYAVSYSRIGSWLDATFDRAKEYAVYAGLALGAARHDDDVWTLALVAMVVMTTRHIVDFSFNETRRGIGGGDDEAADGGAGAKLSGKLNNVGWTVWARRMIILPIGERWALIAVLTATTTPRITFVVLIVGCVLAACYTTLGRVLRSLPRRAPSVPQVGEHLAALADSGPLAELIGRSRLRVPAPAAALLGALALVAVLLAGGAGEWWGLAGAGGYALCAGVAVGRPLVHRLDWVVPPIFRAAEYAAITIVAAQVVPASVAAAFGLVAATAYHHYDTVYRLRGGYGAPPRALVWLVLGHEGRVLLVTVLAALGASTLRVGLVVTAVVLAVIVLTESIVFWVRGARPDIDDVTPVGPAPAAPAPSHRPLEAAAASDRTGDSS
jgi:phosphatidylglycerophosphate synthase